MSKIMKQWSLLCISKDIDIIVNMILAILFSLSSSILLPCPLYFKQRGGDKNKQKPSGALLGYPHYLRSSDIVV